MKIQDIDKDIKISTVGKDDYPELEGELVTYFDGLFKLNCVVVGCNRSLGITIVQVSDKTSYQVCLTGASAPGGMNSVFTKENGYDMTYDEYFDFMIAGIKAGYIDAKVLSKLKYKDRTEFGGQCGSNCAYGQ